MKEPKEKVKDWFTKAGQSVANKLNGWINPLSPATKKKGFIFLGILISMVCAMLMIRSFQSNEGSSSVLRVEQITTPADIHPGENTLPEDSERTIIEQYNRMIRFKELVEKLSSSGDRRSLDSLMTTHPGLRDSLNEFLKLYY